ncbi:hypothetical protein [Sulfobacillus thermosulfidooxidans]|uniref:hypothetical protein n=1 Tax=Sulfobacillus thermosulfidooxidans TaxID=28034 RepID=UPI0014941DEF|nr:hypothetical protein [Sulfobacillus thermosulfidooxidans]
MCRTNPYGFPIAHRQAKKQYCGFQTGDLVIAHVSKGRYAGVWKGRIAVRASGSFVLSSSRQKFDVRYTYCRLVQRDNGWYYTQKTRGIKGMD